MRKFLSLVLALAMAMSLVVVNTSAKEFTDDDELNYDEAVAVISEIGVVDGYADGSFNPQGGLTRGAAAKIICNLILGPTTAAELHADTRPFSDVAINSEFAGYIAYCAQQGIISGYADGEFKAANPLTGYAFMKMLLGALGYSSDIENYVGENWSINVAKQAIGIGLNKGLVDEFNGVDYVTREEAALYAFNTLKATLVDYENKISANVNGAEVTISNNTAYPVTWSEGINRDGNIKDDGFVQFAEEFFPDLVRNDDHTKFMEPANTWLYEKTEIGTFERLDLIVETYTTGVTGRDLYDLLKPGVIDDNDLEVYVDGQDAYGSGKLTNNFYEVSKFDEEDLVRSNTDNVGATGDGVLTKVYLDTDKDLITIVSINTFLAKAAGDYNESNEYAPLVVYYGRNNASQSYNVDVEEVENVVDVTEDTFYQVNMSWKDNDNLGEIVILNDVEVLEDSTITKYSSDNGNIGNARVTKITTGGEEYNDNVMAFYDEDVLYKYDEALLTDATYNIYLDQYGYFLGVDLFEGTKNYVFITGFDRNSSNLSVKTATAGAIFLDGTMEAIEVNVTETDKNIRKAAGENADLFVEWSDTRYSGPTGAWADQGKYGEGGIYDLNQWYTYTVNDNGVYTLKPAVRMTWTTYEPKADGSDTIIRTDNLSIADKHPNDNIVDDLSGRVYGEDATVFLTVDLDEVDTSNGIKAITDVNGVYTGVQSVDIIVDTEDPNAVEKGQVYTVFDSDGYVIAAVVIGEAQGNTGNLAYILSEAKSEGREDGVYYWTFEAIMDGEKQTLTAKSSYTNTIGDLDPYTVQELRFDGDYVVDVKDVDDVYDNFLVDLDGEDVYLADGSNGANNDPTIVRFQRNTLYVTEVRDDYGLAILPSAKAVVIQPENEKAEVITNFPNVESAINHLADADNDATNGKQYKGDIIAVLNSNGAAEWVVFKSETPLITGSQGGTTISSGNITLTPYIWESGYATASYTVTRPNYITDTVALNYNVTVYVNGQPYDTFSAEIDANQPSDTDTWDNNGFNWMTRPIAVGDRITATVSFPQTGSGDSHDMDNQEFILKVVDQRGNDLSDVLYKPSNNAYWVVATGTGTNRTFDFIDSLYQSGSFRVTKIDGGTASVALPTADIAWNSNVDFNITADGDDFVTVTIDTSKMKDAAVTYSVGASKAFDESAAADAVMYNGNAGTPTAIEDLGLGAALTGETGTVLVDFVDNTGTSKVSGIVPGYSVKVKVTTASLVAAAADVAVIVNGNEYKDGDWITVNGNLEVQGLRVKLTDKLAITGAEMSKDGLTMTIKFNQRASMKTGVAETVANIISGGVPATVNSIVSLDLNGDELEIKFSRAMVDGDKLQISDTNILGSNIDGNVVTGNRVIRVNLDGDGKYTCGVNAT